jgi:hypothetical protein
LIGAPDTITYRQPGARIQIAADAVDAVERRHDIILHRRTRSRLRSKI